MSSGDKSKLDNIKTTGLSKATVVGGVADGECVYWRYGNLVMFQWAGNLNFKMIEKNNIVKQAIITGLPGTPKQNFIFPIGIYNDKIDVGNVFAVFANGNIYVAKQSDVSNASYCYISGVYICN